MNLKPRYILIATIFVLILFLPLWFDNLYSKTSGFLGYYYEITKIILLSSIAYKITKWGIRKFRMEERFKTMHPNKIFLVIFLLFNSYIICQYTTRIISHRIVNNEIRNVLNARTLELELAGWGYECDTMSYAEFKELTKYEGLPDIPKEASLIFVHDWYEVDFRRTIKFNLPPRFNLEEFYKNDSKTWKNFEKIEIEYNEKTYELTEIDSTKYAKYKWEVSDS